MSSSSKTKITKEFLDAARLSFLPETEDEAAEIAQFLIDKGYEWCRADRSLPDKLKRCVQKGMGFRNRVIVREPDLSLGYKPFSLQELREGYDENELLLSVENRILYRKFNALSAQVAALTEMVARIAAAVEPARELDKAGLKSFPGKRMP